MRIETKKEMLRAAETVEQLLAKLEEVGLSIFFERGWNSAAFSLGKRPTQVSPEQTLLKDMLKMAFQVLDEEEKRGTEDPGVHETSSGQS